MSSRTGRESPTAKVEPLDPDSPAGHAAAEALSQVLAEIQVAIWRRRAAAKQTA
jgi:hypothetical protein